MNIYLYKIEGYGNEELYTDGGFVTAESYSDAVGQIENYYGEELVEITHVSKHNPIISCAPDVIDKINQDLA